MEKRNLIASLFLLMSFTFILTTCGGGGGENGSGGESGSGGNSPSGRVCGGTTINNEWSISTLDCGTGQYGRVGRATSMAVDSQNKVHISYHDDDKVALKYATNSSGSWTNIYLENGQGVFMTESSIVTDGQDKVHVCYQAYKDIRTFMLKYTTNKSGVWTKEIIDEIGDVGRYNAIAIDQSGFLHVAYTDFWIYDPTFGLKYATNKNGKWESYTIDNVQATEMKIAIDSNNNVHITYMDYGTKDLKYATNATGTWQSIILDKASGWDNDIAIDSQNIIHISHFTETPDFGLKYTTNRSGNWVTEIVNNKIAWFTSIAIDKYDKVHICYFDNNKYNLNYVNNIKGIWETEVVDSTLDVGRYNDMKIDKDDNIHISYHHWYFYNGVDIGDLKYATKKIKR